MIELLQALVERGRCAELDSGCTREVGSRLLTEFTEPRGCLLESRPRRRIGVHKQAHDETDDGRLDPRLQQSDPCTGAEDEIDQPDAHGDGADDEHAADEGTGYEQ